MFAKYFLPKFDPASSFSNFPKQLNVKKCATTKFRSRVTALTRTGRKSRSTRGIKNGCKRRRNCEIFSFFVRLLRVTCLKTDYCRINKGILALERQQLSLQSGL